MQRAQTTVVAVVAASPEGDAALDTARRLASARNVRLVDDAAAGVGLAARGAATLRAIAGTQATYAVSAFDPLGRVAEAWTRTYAGVAARGELEVAVEETRSAAQAGALELPDYYLVLAPEDWPPTRRHWYLGALHEHAPHRVVPTDARPDPAVLAGLDAGRWWPPLERLLDRLVARLPDAPPSTGPRGAGLLDPAGRAHPPASELSASGDDEVLLPGDPRADLDGDEDG
ncbi:MAG: hypothetical protein ACQETV_07020 [Actinomycetota bacterium]